MKPFALLKTAALATLLLLSPALAQEKVWHHGLAAVGEPKYPEGFAHFDYVNVDAPKGGTVRLGDMGGFDAVALQKYHWVEKINHVHTAGNSSGIVDGAALVVIGNEQTGREQGLQAKARILATAVSGADPTIMLTGPAPANLASAIRVWLFERERAANPPRGGRS